MNKRFNIKPLSMIVGALALQAISVTAASTDANSFAIEEIVVTAQKRAESLQDVPLAVSAFDESIIESRFMTDLTDLNSLAPNVVLQPVGAFSYGGAFSIRGMSYSDIDSAGEPSVGVVIDGVQLARNAGNLMDMHDVERIEVLRGPQGTLFGKNNIGGVVNVITRKPSDEFEGNIKLTAGNNGRMEMRGMLNLPLVSDLLNARLSVLSKQFDGYYENVLTGDDLGAEDSQSARLSFRLTPSESVDITLVTDYIKERNDGSPLVNFSTPDKRLSSLYGLPAYDEGDIYKVRNDADIYANLDSAGLSLEANLELGSGTLTYVGGWREMDTDTMSDFDGDGALVFHAQRDETHEQSSHELRFTSNSDGAFDYVTGVYFSAQEFELHNIQDFECHLFFACNSSVPIGALVFTGKAIAAQEAESKAIFFQGNLSLSDSLTATAGGRYTMEEKEFEFLSVAGSGGKLDESWSNFSPKLGIDWQMNDDIMLYGQWARGFRSGQFGSRAATLFSAGPSDPESVDTYEVGLKSDLWNQRVRLNLAAFYSQYSDMQGGVQRVSSSGTHETVPTNSASANIWGFEYELTAMLAENLSINMTGGYLSAKYDDYIADLTADGIENPTDNSFYDISWAPKLTLNFSANYTIPVSYGTFTLNGSYNFSDEYFTSSLKTDDLYKKDAAGLINASVSFSDVQDRYRIALYGKNLAGHEDINNVFGVGPFMDLGVYGQPRTFGVDVQVNF